MERSFYWNAVQKFKKGIELIERLLAPLHGTTAQKLQTVYWNAVGEIEAKGVNSETPLHDAASYNSIETAKLLLELGAEIEASAVNNGTPLHLAAWNNRKETAKLLLECGAEIEARDVANKTPLNLAEWNDSTESPNIYLNAVQKFKKGMELIQHLSTTLHGTTAQKLQNL